MNLTKNKESILEFLQKRYLQEDEPTVKIPVEKGELGHSLDDSIEEYKKDILSGKPWEEMSKQLNTLVVFNKDKHPDVAEKARSKREELSRWVENKRKENPKFGD